MNQPTEREMETLLRRDHPYLWAAFFKHRTHAGKRLIFKKNPFIRDIYCDRSENLVVKKSSQCGVSEYLIVRSIMEASVGRGVFYILPTVLLQSRFVRNRFTKSIEYSEFYRSLARSDEAKTVESVSLKRFGKGSIAFVGSNASAAFTEFPADEIVIDELDKCNQENLPMAESRLGASIRPARVKVSNPSIENYGIDIEYANSDKKVWQIPCSSCGKWIQPDFFHHVVMQGDGPREWIIRDDEWEPSLDRDIYPICHLCGKPFERFEYGEWVKTADSRISGYHISKMFSSNVKISDMVDNFNRGLGNDFELQSFYNFDLGLAFTSSGSKISYPMLDECVGDYNFPVSVGDSRCFIGIDVGAVLHVVIGRRVGDRQIQLVFIGTANDENDIFQLAKEYNVVTGVIDAMPETRLSKKICARLRYCFMIYYGDVRQMSIREDGKSITIDRTQSLDEVKEKVMLGEYLLPSNARYHAPMVSQHGIEVSEFYAHMCSSTRVYDQDRERYDWVHTEPDHFFHAMNYLTIAGKLLRSLKGNR